MSDSCETCANARLVTLTQTNPGGAGITTGPVWTCRALPPRPANGNPWPIVDHDDWCAAFKAIT